MKPHNVRHSRLLDEAVDAFESALATGTDCQLADFLPSRNSAEFESILLELIRVDLERSWRCGEQRRTEDYCMDFPEALKVDALRSQVAYEEYRVRLHAGQPVSANSLKDRLAISTDDWPKDVNDDQGVNSPRLLAGQGLPSTDVMIQRAVDAFPEFDVIAELGRGSFGCVFLAKQRTLAERLVTIKITADTTLEPERLAVLQHTAIVPIYSVHRTDSWQAMCMPYFGQATLQSVVDELQEHADTPTNGHEAMAWLRQRYRSSSQPRVFARFGFCAPEVSDNYIHGCCHVIAEIAAGLHHAHERGVLHRDIKPANILIADDGRPMLLDFNLSSDSTNLSSSQIVGGTLPYMAPEQLAALEDGAAVGHQSDIYSLGVILFELLTGQLPFPLPERRFDQAELIEHLIAQRTPTVQRPGYLLDIRKINDRVPHSVAAIVARCLNATPGLRYATAQELNEDLVADLHHMPLQHTPNPSTKELLQKWRRRHPRIVSLGSLVLFICIAAAIGLFSWRAREFHVTWLEAQAARHQFHSSAADARTLLSVPDVSVAVTNEGAQLADGAIEIYQTMFTPEPPFSFTEPERISWQQTAGELHYLLASARLGQSRSVGSTDARHQLLTESLHANQRAMDLLSNGQPTSALSLQRNEILRAMGRKAAPETHVSPSPVLIQNDVDAFVTASHAVTHGRAATVLPLLEALALQNPQDYSIWFLRGKALALTGNRAAADSCFSVCIAFHSDCWRAHLERGILRHQAGLHGEAESDFDTVVDSRSDVAAAFVNRAITRQAAGRFDDALADLDRAIELGGPSRCWFLRARCHAQAGNVDAARRDHRTGLSTVPSDELSWIARGVAQLPQFPGKAVADFREALAINPRSADALQNIAHVQSEVLQQPESAIDSLDALIAFYPQQTQAITSRAVLHARLGKAEEALRDVKLALTLPCSPLETYQLGCVFALLPENEFSLHGLALDHLKQALNRDLSLAHSMKTDTDLAAIKETPQFQHLIESAETLSMKSENK